MTTFIEQMQEMARTYLTTIDAFSGKRFNVVDEKNLNTLIAETITATLKEVERVVEGLPEIYGGYKEDEESPILPFVAKQEVIQALSKVTGE